LIILKTHEMWGTLNKNDPNVGTGLVGAPACGDVMRLQIKVNDEGVIEEAKFKTFGCGSAIASSSLVTEWVTKKTIEEAEKITNQEIVEELSLPPVKVHCSVLAEDAIKAAIKDWREKCEKKIKFSEFEEGDGYPISITPIALEAIKDAISLENLEEGLNLRVGLRGGGCAGFEYVLDFTTPKDYDYVMVFGEIEIYIDPVSAMHLEGTTIDYITSLMGFGF
jgi:nitrogen fixation NifU-like protein